MIGDFMITYSRFFPGDIIGQNEEEISAAKALDDLLTLENPTASYSQMMRYRLSGKASNQCCDNYFIALDDGICVSRIWYGWGKHDDAIGNFGNFLTANDHQRMGIGSKLLMMLFDDLNSRNDKPIGLFCTAGKEHLVQTYGKYGFRLALKNTTVGRLYCPLKNSPPTFSEFCEEYYQTKGKLRFIPGTIAYRHEIDCLLSFAFDELKIKFGFEVMPSYEIAILTLLNNPNAGKLEVIVNDINHVVGWAWTPNGMARLIQVHPKFSNNIIE
jgi:GNAT superfamily N-acetyltransferase